MAAPFTFRPHFPRQTQPIFTLKAKLGLLAISVLRFLSQRVDRDPSYPGMVFTRGKVLGGKEREHVCGGHERTLLGNSFIRMTLDKCMTGIAYMSIGAFAAYLGMWTLNQDAHWMPVLCSSVVALAGFGIAARKGRALAHPGTASAGRSWDGRQDRRTSPVQSVAGNGSEGDAALLGHEMKNYLCTLKGNAHLLRQRIPSNDQVIIDRIDRVVEKLETFTCSLSGARHAATGSGVLWQVRPAEAALECVRTHFHDRQEVFSIEAREETPTLLCDPGRLDQVLVNLYANALEAGASKVTTETRREGGRLVVRVEDNGHGCAQEDLERIFEPFFTTKQGPARHGLGMFIVQSIVENHGGRIRVRTKNGGEWGRTGLVFTLEFPLSAAEEPAMALPSPLAQAPAESELNWLLTGPIAA